MEQRTWIGVAAVGVLWSTQTIATTSVGFDLLGDRPLSYLVDEPASRLLFSVGLALSACMFIVFHQHLRGRYLVDPFFSVAMVAAMIGQFVAGVVPVSGSGPAPQVHVTSALVLGACIPVFMWRFAASQQAGAWRVRCYRLFWLEAAACVVGVALSRLHVAALAEIVPAVVFHAWVITVTLGDSTRTGSGVFRCSSAGGPRAVRLAGGGTATRSPV